MALIRWGTEEEDKKKEEPIFGSGKQVQSVQSAWQPTQSDTATPQLQDTNYLMSEQKAQIDAQQRAQREAEEAARAEAAARAAAAQAAAQAAQAAQSQNTAAQPQAPKQQTRKTKYTQPAKEGGLMGLLKGIGAGIQQGLGAVGDIAIQGGGVLGSIGKSGDDLVRHVDNVNRTRAILHNQRDMTGQNITGTRDVDAAASRIASGQGSAQDFISVGSKGVQAGIDSTMFLNPARMAITPLSSATRVASNIPARVMSSPAARYAMRDAAFFGGLQGVATTGREYGESGDIIEALKAGGQDALIGGLLQGSLDLGGHMVGRGVNRGRESLIPVANKTINSLRRPREFRVGDEVGEAIESAVAPPQERTSGQPVTQDGNVSFEPINQPTTPQAQPQPINNSSILTPVGRDAAPVADGIVQTPNVMQNAPDMPDAQSPIDDVNLRDATPEQAPPEQAPPERPPLVADGRPQPVEIPADNPSMPTIRSEQVRQLQEARVGTTQAQEAEINQRLQEAEAKTPYVRKNIDDLEGNGQTIEDKELTDAIRENGVTPLLVDENGKLFEGQHRLESLKALGAKDVPTQSINLAGFNKLSDDAKMEFLDDYNLKTPKVKVEADAERQLQDARAGTTPPRQLEAQRPVKKSADDELADIDARLERGEIDFDEAGRLEDEIFARENAAGRMMAEDSNLPDELEIPMPTKADGATTPKPVDPARQARKDFANVFTRSTDSNSDMQGRLARSVDMAKDAESDVSEILSGGGVTGKQAERITKLFDRAAEIAENNKATQKQYRKDFIKGGKEAIDDAPARKRNRETDEAAYLRNQLNSELKKLERKGDWGEKVTQGFENVISGKNTNQLIGAPIERGLTAEVIGNAMNTIKAPIKQIRGATMHGMPGKSAVKRLVRDIKTPPKTVTEGYKYLIGNTYRAAMTPAQALADSRKGAFRTELTKYAYKNKIGETLSNKDAERVSRMAGNDMEALVNMGAGVDNGTINILAYRKALKQWKKFIESGSESDYGNFMDTIDRQTSIVDKLAQGFSTQGKNRAQRAGLTLVNALLPYMRNAVNMSTRGVVLDLNPFTLSLLDGIRTDQRGFMSNLALGIKNKTVDYAVLAALGSVLTYNDGTDPDTVDQPRGVSIHLGGDEYFAIRGTPLELPLGAIMVAKQLAEDGASGKLRDAGYYAGMITPSIPYVDYMTSHGNVIDSIEKWGTEEGDGGYAAKNFAVGTAKSLTPFSNNNVEASLSRLSDKESLTAKSVYDKDMGQWYKNSLANNNLGKVLPFIPDRSELKDSRDAAGRVRTVDNQGSWMRKKINDKNTATYNDTVTDLVKYARDAGLGKGTQDMFSTFDNGKNNHFNTIQSGIWAATGKEGAETKLTKNDKLVDLSKQIESGFYGDGDELLTVGGDNLYSDVSMPNARGSKNSSKPINMRSIRQAIAAVDLPENQRNRLHELGQEATGLYDRAKSGEISWDERKQLSANIAAEEREILTGSDNYKKMTGLMDKLRDTGFFAADGLGATRSGQTYLWNALNTLLGSKGKTPAAEYPKEEKGSSGGRRRSGGRSGSSGARAVIKPGEQGTKGIKWSPVKARQMADAKRGKLTPFKVKVKLGNEVKRDKTQNYAEKTI